MHVRKRAGLTTGILTLITAATFGIVAPAQAAASSSVWVDTDGTRAGEALFNRSNGTHANRAWFDINDKKCDASSVYLEYKLNGEIRAREAKADGGCGTSAGENLSSGYFTVSYRVCVHPGPFSSKCSGWRSDHN